MAEVTVKTLSRRYETTTLTGPAGDLALDSVDLTIADGETVCLVGPSGCGKSTLLKCVAGLEFPDSGTVHYDDKDVTNVRPQDRGVGMVFQDYALYPSMKGKGNLDYYFDQHKDASREEAEARIKEVARIMGIGFDVLLGQKPGTLSGGEQQRVAIARCITRDPSLFLMDEPICNLDAKLRESTRVEMKKLLRRFGLSALYVTHDQQEAVFMGDRIAVMRTGRIEQIGTFDELYYEPVNLFVASFIGSPPIGVLPVTVSGDRILAGTAGGGPAEASWPMPAAAVGKVPDGPARLGVRPEDWTRGTDDGIGFTLRRAERLPAERATFLRGETLGTGVTVAAPLEVQEEPHTRITPDTERCVLFSATDEAALHVPGVPDLF